MLELSGNTSGLILRGLAGLKSVAAWINLSSSWEDLVMGQRNLYWGAVGVFEEGVVFPDVVSVNLALFFVVFAAWICCISPPLKTYICA